MILRRHKKAEVKKTDEGKPIEPKKTSKKIAKKVGD